jgi:hypothetical protein
MGLVPSGFLMGPLADDSSQLEEQLREERGKNGQLISASQGQMASLDSEYRFAMDNASRLEENIRQHDYFF